MAAPTLVQDAGLPQAQIIDKSIAGTTIICSANPGTLPTDPYWQIQKIVVVGNVTTITWGGPSPNGPYGKYDQIAANRLTSVVYA